MRVLGGNDYYDGAMAHGQDDRLLFVRGKRTEQIDFLPWPSWDCFETELMYFNNHGDLTLTAVYFCGKLYVGFNTGDGVCWSMDQLEKHLASKGQKMGSGARRAFVAFFDKWQGFDGHAKRLVELGVTVAVCDDRHRLLRHRRWKVNGPDLQGCEFYRMMDTHSAFQEISMWVGGVLSSTGPETVTINDERVRIEKRGFDAKKSFRKEPTKRK